MPEPLVVERRVQAAPATVYRYLTGSEEWARWQGADAHIEAVPGGIFRIAMPAGQSARGQFVHLEENRRVVFSWGWIDHPGLPPGSTTVEIELLPLEDGATLVRLTHHALPPEEVELHELGWRHYLPRLQAVAEGRDPGADPGPGTEGSGGGAGPAR